MKSIAGSISYGTTELHYELLMMDRKSLEIAVHPDKSLVVKAPMNSSLDAIEGRIKKRAGWIKRQIAYFSQFEPRTPPRLYVSGESHPYLGRKYRLKILPSDKNRLLLKNGYFYIQCVRQEATYIQRFLEAWYKQRALIYLPKALDDCWDSFNRGKYVKPELKLQRMKKRWGSLSSNRQLRLNTNLIQTPKECIEYVIIHELCHLVHPHHGTEFYKLLDQTMPNWSKSKHKLEMALV